MFSHKHTRILYELTRWWAYRRIEHPEMSIYVWWLPSSISVIATLLFAALPIPPKIFGDSSLMTAITQVLAILPGFFIASLAAVATFDRPEMDVEMPPEAPKISIKLGAVDTKTNLTRRMFLTYLFAYLSIVSLLLVAICSLSSLLAPSFASFLQEAPFGTYTNLTSHLLKWGFVAFVFYWCASLFITTLHGIYFLIERMHQPN